MARILVQQARFDVGAEMAAFDAVPDTGGLGCFVGLVRSDGGIAALTLEHYPGATERALALAAAEAERRWALHGCTIIHRVGRLAVGEPIVLVIAASRHRAAALEATRYLIDWLKTGAPLWKREERADGSSQWMDGCLTQPPIG